MERNLLEREIRDLNVKKDYFSSNPAIGPNYSNQPSPAKDWCSIRERAAYFAIESELDWLDFSNEKKYPEGRIIKEGEKLKGESTYRMIEYLEDYWTVVRGDKLNPPEYQDINPTDSAKDSAKDNIAWSAAFISWVMSNAGIEEADGFLFSRRHLTYIVQALSNARKNDFAKPIHLVELTEPVAVGDLICRNRRPEKGLPMTNYTLDSLAKKYLDKSDNVIDFNQVRGVAHCDIITEIFEDNGKRYIRAIGGNVSNSVTQQSVKGNVVNIEIDQNNVIVKKASDVFAIIKLGYCNYNNKNIDSSLKKNSSKSKLDGLKLVKDNKLISQKSNLSFREFEDKILINPIYGGITLQINPNKSDLIGIPDKTYREYIKQLQKDLISLGFKFKSVVDGKFDFDTECCVREFQIYAKMPNVAFQRLRPIYLNFYSEFFGSTPNTNIFQGEIDGIVTPKVANLIQFWISNGYKCPVIVQPWEMEDKDGVNRLSIHNNQDNIWKFNEVTSTNWTNDKEKSFPIRMFARDYSGYYSVGNDYNDIGKRAAIIRKNKKGVKIKISEGPSSEGRGSASTEITPEDILDKKLLDLSDSERSTFMVIRAVSNVECEGFLDRINAYDRAFLSFGPYHWIIGLSTSSGFEGGGELPAFIAFVKQKKPQIYERAFGFFGLKINFDWSDVKNNFYNSGSKNYSNGRFAIIRKNKIYSMENGSRGVEMGNYFRSWHWLYRFIMATRMFQPFRKCIWDFARLRIRDISSIEIKGFGFTNDKGIEKNPTISEIFTSEKAFAMILRIHVFLPAQVINLSSVKSKKHLELRQALTNSFIKMKEKNLAVKNYSQWTDKHQEFLIAEILGVFNDNDDLTNTLGRLVNEPIFRNIRLFASKDSFKFNSDNLPSPVV
jgi:hypothetical protein